MKRSLGLVAALALSASLATVSTGSADAAPAHVLSKPQLRHALLTVNDLPKGFKVDRSVALSSGSSDDGTTFDGDPACATWLSMAEPVLNDPAAPKASRSFSHDLESIEIGAQAFGSATRARKSFAHTNGLIGACHHVTAHEPIDGTTTAMQFTFTRHEFRAQGHRAFAATMRVRFQGITVNMAITGAQVRNTVVEAVTTGFGKRLAVETRLAKSLLRAQAEKLERQLR